MDSSSFNDRSFENDCGTKSFLVLASFRGQTKKDEGERDEKSGMVFYGGKYASSRKGLNIIGSKMGAQ